MRDEVMTGVRPKADQKIIDNATASPAATHRWYGAVQEDVGLVRMYGPSGEWYADGRSVLPANPECNARNNNASPITYLRAREILGSAWPASWPQTDPDAPAPLPKAADADGWDYYAQHGVRLLWRYRPGLRLGQVSNESKVGGWETQDLDAEVTRDIWGKNTRDFGPASRAACEAFLRGDKPNPDSHDDGSQSRRTGASTAAKCPGLLSTDETTASATPGTDARAGGVDVVREYARLSLVADAAELVKAELGYVSKPSHHASGDEWTEYAAWQREHATLEGKFTEAFGAKYEFMKANLAALKAALGVA